MAALLALFGAGGGAAGAGTGAAAGAGAGTAIGASGAAGTAAVGSTAGALAPAAEMTPAIEGSLAAGGTGAAVPSTTAPIAGAPAVGSSNLGNIWSLLHHTVSGGLESGPEGAGYNFGAGLRNMLSGKPIGPSGGESFSQASQGAPVVSQASQGPDMMALMQQYVKRQQQERQQQPAPQPMAPQQINAVGLNQGLSPQIMQLMQAFQARQRGPYG